MQRVIAVAANFTAEPVAESLAFWLHGFGLPVGVEVAPFDQVFQQLLDPSSLLGANRSGADAILLRLDLWIDGTREADGGAEPGSLRAKIEELADAVRAASRRFAVPLVVALCPADPRALSDSMVARQLADAESWLVAELLETPNVQLITSGELLARRSGDYFDPDSDTLGRIPYTETFFATIGTALARRMRAALGLPYKVVVLDCDNTLWRGILGEAGPMGVEIDAPLKALQQLIVRQHEAGMLVCLCSKNNESDVRELFHLRTDMTLSWDQVVSARINWEPKSENLKSLAAELNLGLSSFVFVDDSPFEIAEVRRNCPDVLALQLPTDPEGIQRFVEHTWVFDHVTVTATDRLRAASYTQNARRDDVRKRSASLEDFLRDLDLCVEIAVPGPADLERASQMTLRTNQFNLSTVRRTAAELGVLLESGALEGRVVGVRDRFGDYGIVGLVLFEARESALRVDTFLLSCRALGRRVEHRMLMHLGEVARERGLTAIELPFVRSERNTPALRFLDSVTHRAGPMAAEYLFVVTPDVATAAPFLVASEVDAEGAAAAAADEAARAPAADVPSVDGELVSRLYMELHDPRRLVRALRASRTNTRDSSRPIVEPRNEIEETLVGIWKEVLRLDRIGVTDSFFDLGGNSLAALPMFVRLRKLFNTSLGPTALLEAPTIAQLAGRLSGAAQPGGQHAKLTSLLPLQRGGSRTPLFLIHAGAGTIFVYHQLATALGSDQPVYGLQVQGLYDEQRPHWTIEEMAAHYVAEMRTVQPAGPYRLAGFCLGATIALEVALQLEGAGYEVSFLGSFDGAAPGYRGGSRGSAAAQSASRRLWYRVTQKLDRTRNRLLLRYTNRRGAPIPRVFQRAGWYFTVNNMFAKTRYRPSETFAGRMHVFTIAGRYADPSIGWSRWVRGGVVPHEIAGEFRLHRDLMRPPMVHRVVELLEPVLDGDVAVALAYTERVRPIVVYNEPISDDARRVAADRSGVASDSSTEIRS
jgi:FkbH-like protein